MTYRRKSTRSSTTDILRVPHCVELLLDRRYRISLTWVGKSQQQWVGWFGDEFVGWYGCDLEAAQALREYRTNVQGFADYERATGQ